MDKEKPKWYKIQNKETHKWLYLIGSNRRVEWGIFRHFADVFDEYKLDKFKENHPEIDFKKCKLIKVDKKELLEDESRLKIIIS